MPRKVEIAAIKVINNGNIRWRVIVPVDLRNRYKGVQARYFETPEDGRRFASELKAARQDPVFGRVALFPPPTQMAVIRTIESIGLEPNDYDLATTLLLRANNDAPENEAIFTHVIEACILAKQALNVTGKYLADLKSTGKKFADTFGEVKIHTITREQGQAWLNHCMAGEGANARLSSPASRLQYLRNLRVIFNWAVEQGYCKENVFTAVNPPYAGGREPWVLSPVQVKALLAAALKVDLGMVPFFAICCFAGMRPEECKRLEAHDIDLDNGIIEVQRGKAKGREGKRKRRLVTILPVLKSWLELGFQFPLENWRARFDAVREAAGLIKVIRPENAPGKWGTRDGRYPIECTGWGHDCLRHSFISYHLALHKDAPRLAIEVGHEGTDTMFEHYRAIRLPNGGSRIDAALGEAYFKLTPKAVRK